MSKRHTVCLIVPSLALGGTERVVSIMASEIANTKNHVQVISLLGSKCFYSFNEDVELLFPASNHSRLLGKFSILFKLYKMLKKKKPDVIVSFGEVFNPFVILISRLLDIPVFVADRSSPLRKQKTRTVFLRKFLYPLAQGLLVQTKIAQQSALSKKYNDNVCLLPNPLLDFGTLQNFKKKKIVITTGRLVDSKNHKELIQIFSAANENKDWMLHIIGDGPNKEKLLRFINENGYSQEVVLMGSKKDVQYLLAESSIFAFSSLSEGFPNSLSEAIATPLPVIAYNCIAGPADLIEDEVNGFLIPVNDRELYVKRLALLMEDEALRETFTRGFNEHRKKYSAYKITQQLLSFIDTSLS